jgi:mRNA-degrading endonuclease YafQ of YafQ-DinJ toxin-antitoxin module
MFKDQVHPDAVKSLAKAQPKIKAKADRFRRYLINFGTYQCPFPIKPLKGHFHRFHYYEAKIDKDYRIIFRKEGDTFYIRAAGTHNELRTG